jgi:methionyl-tRNA formyltransferase
LCEGKKTGLPCTTWSRRRTPRYRPDRRVSIAPEDSAFSLFNKLCVAAGELLDASSLIKEGRAPRIPQDPEKATYFGGRRPEDGRIDWNRP